MERSASICKYHSKDKCKKETGEARLDCVSELFSHLEAEFGFVIGSTTVAARQIPGKSSTTMIDYGEAKLNFTVNGFATNVTEAANSFCAENNIWDPRCSSSLISNEVQKVFIEARQFVINESNEGDLKSKLLQALGYFRKFLDSNSRNYLGYQKLGNFLFQYDRALKGIILSYREALSIWSHDPVSLLNAGIWYHKKDDINSALECYNISLDALKIDDLRITNSKEKELRARIIQNIVAVYVEVQDKESADILISHTENRADTLLQDIDQVCSSQSHDYQINFCEALKSRLLAHGGLMGVSRISKDGKGDKDNNKAVEIRFVEKNETKVRHKLVPVSYTKTLYGHGMIRRLHNHILKTNGITTFVDRGRCFEEESWITAVEIIAIGKDTKTKAPELIFQIARNLPKKDGSENVYYVVDETKPLFSDDSNIEIRSKDLDENKIWLHQKLQVPLHALPGDCIGWKIQTSTKTANMWTMTYDSGPRAGVVMWTENAKGTRVIQFENSERRRYSYSFEVLNISPELCDPVWDFSPASSLPSIAWAIPSWIILSVKDARKKCGHRCNFVENVEDADFVVRDYIPLDLSDQLKTLLLATEPFHKNMKKEWPHVMVWGFDRSGDAWWLPSSCSKALKLYEQHKSEAEKRRACDAKRNTTESSLCLDKLFENDSMSAPQKNSVGIIISNCLGYAGASVKLRNELAEAIVQNSEIPHSSYGRCWTNASMDDSYTRRFDYRKGRELRQRHILSVASENSEFRDYVTEKIWESYLAGVIPIYSGAENIHEYVPGQHSLIYIADSESITEGIQKIKEVLQNQLKQQEKMREGWDWSGSEMINRCQQFPPGNTGFDLCTACELLRSSCSAKL
eukprot:g3889.t1